MDCGIDDKAGIFELCAHELRDGDLSGMAFAIVNPGIERVERNLDGFDGKRISREHGPENNASVVPYQGGDRRHERGAVYQRKSLFGGKRDQRETGAAHGFRSGEALSLVIRFP